MPKRKWRLGGPTSYREAKEARGNLEFRRDMAESAKDQKDSDELLSQEKYLKMNLVPILRELNKGRRKNAPKMDKLKEQRKFNQRKKVL